MMFNILTEHCKKNTCIKINWEVMGINATKVEKTKLKKQLFNCKIPYDWRIFVLKNRHHH